MAREAPAELRALDAIEQVPPYLVILPDREVGVKRETVLLSRHLQGVALVRVEPFTPAQYGTLEYAFGLVEHLARPLDEQGIRLAERRCFPTP